MTTNNDRFQFQVLPKDIANELPKDTIELLEKWGMKDRMKFKCFSYNRHFQSYQKQSFTEDLFASEVVNSSLEIRTKMDSWATLNMSQSIDEVSVVDVPAKTLSMSFFDRLKSGVVRESGHIVKCFDEMVDDFLISDELKKMFLHEESDYYTLYSDDEKREFLYRILQHLVLGGPVNQYEDLLNPYLDTAKLFYKTLLLVLKDPNTNQLSIVSDVFEIGAKSRGTCVFPSTQDHTQTFCYMIVDNVKRHVTLWYHVWS